MNTLLLLLAVFLTIVLFVPLLLVQSIRNRADLGKYLLNLATYIEYMWGSLLFGTDGHTISATLWKRHKEGKLNYLILIGIVDWLFDNHTHCRDAYMYEFKEG